MKIQIKCPSCFFKYEGEMDKAKTEMPCVCPRCGTPFTYRLADDKSASQKQTKEEAKPVTQKKDNQQEFSNLRICKDCGASFDKSLFFCPSCGCPIDGYSYCPDCNNLVSDKSKTCPNCGSPINGYSYCPDCNTLIAPGHSECPNCGCPIEMQPVPEKKQSMEMPAISQDKMVASNDHKPSCPECQAPISESDTICVNCGSPVNGYFYCPECNQIVPPGAKECPHCGNSFSDEGEELPSVSADENQDIGESRQDSIADQPPFDTSTTSETEKPTTMESTVQQPDIDTSENKEEVASIKKDVLPSDIDDDDDDNSKSKTATIIVIVGIILVVGLFFFFSKCTGHKAGYGSANDSDSVMVDSMKVAEGEVIPLWLVGQWTGTFTDKSMGEFSVLIIINKSGQWTQMITPDGKRGESEVGVITSYTAKSFNVLYDGDKSKTSFEVDESKKSFSLGKGFWLTKE